jgi:uncharacterized membrane protein YheB (UPF0754 family)
MEMSTPDDACVTEKQRRKKKDRENGQKQDQNWFKKKSRKKTKKQKINNKKMARNLIKDDELAAANKGDRRCQGALHPTRESFAESIRLVPQTRRVDEALDLWGG